jgi:hypothetical protein
MKTRNELQRSSIRTGLALALALAMYAPSARANVYATNIKLNGSLASATNVQSGLAISYILNEPATLGTTIRIFSGPTVVNIMSIPSGRVGTLMGLNTVFWGGTNSLGAILPAGTNGIPYSVSITPAANGFPVWTQTSVDTNSGMPANYPLGIDINRNANSPYYGRVVMGCASAGPNTNTPDAAKLIGLFKMNADGSQADEGWFGYAGYILNDAGGAATGQMNNGASAGQTALGYNPMKIRIGDDDRIYWIDNSDYGAIIATDMQATTNQVVISEGTFGGSALGGPYNYENNPDIGDLSTGFQEFDVAFTTTTNAALFLCDNDYPNWGVWMYHLTNAVAGAGLVADPNDTVGTQVMQTGGDVSLVTSGGCMVDNALDIFVGQDRNNINSLYDVVMFTNWNGGVLPPEPQQPGGGAFDFVMGASPGQVYWGFGDSLNSANQVALNDPTFEGLRDVVIDSRANPKFVACPCSTGSAGLTNQGGIRVLNAVNNYGKGFRGTVGDQAGQVVTVTNGSGVVIQTLTNVDIGQAYTCAAWDNVGNLYAASTTRNVWRVWSPPGPNTNTTVAVAQVTLIPPPTITGLTANGTTVTIGFTGPTNSLATAFSLYSSGSVTEPFTLAGGAAISALTPPGTFKAVIAPSGSTQCYQVYGP